MLTISPQPSAPARMMPSRRSLPLPVLPLGGACLALVLSCTELPVRSQDLVGCQLVGGSLQCVPGLTADPQQQIRILDQEIQGNLQLEGAVEQRIEGLRQPELVGQAREGAQLRVRTSLADPNPSGPQTFHWYRRSPGAASWQLISGAGGSTYVPRPEDVGHYLMVVAVVPQADGVKRLPSAAVGPVRPVTPSLRFNLP